jgi:hypothetical protein
MPTVVVRSINPGAVPSNGGPPSGVGHAWVEIHNENGTVESFGFYPEYRAYDAPGEVRNTDASNYSGQGRTSESIPITTQQAQAFRDFAAEADRTGDYSLDGFGVGNQNGGGTWNCASFSAAAFDAANVDARFPIVLLLPWYAPSQFGVKHPVTDAGAGFDPLGNPTGVGSEVNRDYTAARGWTLPRDPLVLDLDGDGIETVGIDPLAPILFDHDADGVKTGTGWIQSDDGLLVIDVNGNGTIDSGRELFGDNSLLYTALDGPVYAADGYAALRAQDSDSDGVVNSLDANFNQLRVWRDLNQDGISQAGELQTLSQAGIASIGVTGTATNTNLGNGNTQVASGSFTRTNGSTGQSGSAQLTGSYLLAGNNRRYLISSFSRKILVGYRPNSCVNSCLSIHVRKKRTYKDAFLQRNAGSDKAVFRSCIYALDKILRRSAAHV